MSIDPGLSNSGGPTAIIRQGGSPRVRKTLEIKLHPDEPRVDVAHRLTNETGEVIEVGPWAITQFRTGGVGWLPLPRIPLDREGLRANTSVIGWSYTDWAAFGFDSEHQILHIPADRTTPTKAGTGFSRGWLAYLYADWMFVKEAEVSIGRHADLGAQAQIYCNELFLELETQAAMTVLRPGDSVGHRETWRLHHAGEIESIIALMDSR